MPESSDSRNSSRYGKQGTKGRERTTWEAIVKAHALRMRSCSMKKDSFTDMNSNDYKNKLVMVLHKPCYFGERDLQDPSSEVTEYGEFLRSTDT
ncbi:predicted protein [Sclerotinia sclerotiorum 1980 UF-70]|uniref:Uncharacterized protein n=1 Tax=Sclerotinia sclerotiorum (strain ATCC 18683 / 1980 / Ss-1) TaxID=665079 RepID=A7ER53_SCLS1|nr:predicted protein [Sclerotinia sclerotiorum 1980 UF-70]EDN91945.1 predicted protein [Sclerotinia sclerotiorum 1980 UF-70]